MVEDSKFSNTILTNIGHQMLASISNGNRKITYTKAEAYTQDVSSISNETLQALTSLQGKELSANLLVSNDNGNVVTITANFENKGLTNDVVFNSIGWFAKLDTDDTERGITANQEYLIGITPANGAQTLVASPADQSSSQAISINLNMTLSDAASVNMTVSDAGAVHFNQLYDQLAEYTTTSDLTKLLAGKADLGLSYTKAELDAKLLNLTADTDGKVSADQVQALISDKANISDVYTKSQIDSALSTRDAQISTKASISDVYTKSQIDSDFSARDTQINTKANISDVYTKSDVDSALAVDRGRLGKLEGTQTLDSPDFNSITSTGVYYITNNTPANIKNNPVVQWGVLVVSNGNGNRTSQVYYPDDGSPQWCRLLNGSNWLPWYQLSTKKDVSNAIDLANQANSALAAKANVTDVTKAQSTADSANANANGRLSVAGGNMNTTSVIQWNGGGIDDKNGNLGGITWNGGTDWAKIYGDQDDNDNLDLAFDLGDDGSNHVSFRKNGSETSAITSDGHFTGTVDWGHVNGRPQDQVDRVNTITPLFRQIQNSNNWNDIFGVDNPNNVLTSIRIDAGGSGALLNDFAAGIGFGGADTKGVLSVAYSDHQARITGGNGTGPVWSEDIAWKSDVNNLRNQVQQLRENQFETQTFTDATAAANWEAQRPGHRLAIIQS
ncbi:pyocin knob domain-containing protein [Lactobacillus amylovorus]|uniref:pyocin knob domain-containing protein n=1 Tax=Lactobacillus amylovorus TaxID=1604 RepID=UPI00232D5DA5|nr:pyocin knob domain-containing protein [Lactobacillus amylovorus]MDB6253616.1 pyocin knob domain-containing protein [Lactobacillus amylovorus]